MTFSDWILDLALIALVLRQIRVGRLDPRFFLLPLGLVGWAAAHYLQAIPTGGNDLALIALVVGVGAVFGLGAGLTTKVWRADRGVLVQATPVAAVLWVAGTGVRLAFQLWAYHGGGASLVSFSRAHDITSAAAWTDALVLMAVAEVVVRMAVIAVRGARARQTAADPVQVDARELVLR